MKFETARIHFLSDVLVCCHPKILLPWQRDVTTSLLGQNDQKISTGPSFFLRQYNVEYVIHRIKVISLKRPMFSFSRN